jgi:hypothetical protein
MSAEELADLLTRFVTVVRATAVDPEAGPAVKLAEIMTFTDTVVAPPPPPCDFPWRLAGRPGAGGSDDGAGGALVLTAGTNETRPPVPS